MKKIILASSLFFLNSSATMAYDAANEPQCVIDQCDEDICAVETPEGWVSISRQPGYKEGKKIVCPIWLVEPT
jgi:hypothetical protein|tara:strand:+ start:1315 stop:1533 length:219 start_codon:yes stop_codon:yes gene_type:complete